jgi:signal transduction histidine kinase
MKGWPAMVNDAQQMQLARAAVQKAFRGLSDEEAGVLLKKGRFRRFPKGERLTVEGENEFVFYVLLEGDVEVTKRFRDDEDRLLNTLGPGAFFGEMSIIDDAPRAATITSKTDVSVMEIDRDAFLTALENPRMSLAMIREVSKRLRQNDEVAISDLRAKAEELSDAYQQLAELERARREFLTTIAHELRTPLTSAAGFMQVISSGMMDGEMLQEGLSTVSRNLSQIVSLTNDILFLQEMDLILEEFKPVDLAKLLQDVIREEEKNAAEMKVTFELIVPEDLPLIPGDEKTLHRALQAILNNAVKFSVNGGMIKVEAIAGLGSVAINILDPGIGIAPEDFENIFERFWRTEAKDGKLFAGVGLGLPIAKQVIEQHGGTLTVESQVDEWTRFTISLPVDDTRRAIA